MPAELFKVSQTTNRMVELNLKYYELQIQFSYFERRIFNIWVTVVAKMVSQNTMNIRFVNRLVVP